MAGKTVWRCIICSTEAPERPPRHCPSCGAPASRWRLMVNRAPEPPPPPPPPETGELAPETVSIEGASPA